MLIPALNRPQSRVGGAFVSSSGLPIASDREVAVPQPRASVPDLTLRAAAVLVKDLNSGVILYEKRAHTPLPIASLTKLLTAIVANARLAPEQVITVSADDLKVPEPRAGLLAGERVYVSDLLAAMLIASSNDAAMALARAAGGTVADFVRLMNEQAKALGMTSSALANPVGLDDAGHFSTAADLGLLVEEFLRYPQLVALTGQKQAEFTSADGKHAHLLATTNKLLLKDAAVLGLKTGYTSEARGNLILLVADPPKAEGLKSVYYSIVLGSDNREEESEAVLSWIRENFLWPSNKT